MLVAREEGKKKKKLKPLVGPLFMALLDHKALVCRTINDGTTEIEEALKETLQILR